MSARVYVAASWRTLIHPYVVQELRIAGFEVYDFRSPTPDNKGFHWSEIDANWQNWTPIEFRDALEHPLAINGFKHDIEALRRCHACVLALPCGRSAHLELGYAAGLGKKTAVLLNSSEPELMYKICDKLCLDVPEVVKWLKGVT